MAEFNALIAEMMKTKNIGDYEFSIEGNTNVGDGYMGEMLFFKILSKENGKTYHLILKIAKNSEKLRKSTTLELNFEREIFMYTTVFKTLESFLASKNISGLNLGYIPKLFWYSTEYMKEALVLENLKETGFAMWKKKEQLDYHHTMMVVRNLARWHGTVMAYRDQHSEQFESWVPHLQDIKYQLVTQMGFINFTKKYYKEIIKLLKVKGYTELSKKYEQFEEKLETFFSPVPDLEDRLVITHADCWINNVMFKFDNNQKKASDCKFFDFQVSHVNTPVEDLSFFIYSASDESVLDNLDVVLQEYHSTLCTTIRSLGSDPQNIFTFDQVCNHWKKYGLLGVISTIEIFKLKYFHEDEVPDFLKLSESANQSIGEAFKKPIRNEDLYLQDVVKVFCKFGNKFL